MPRDTCTNTTGDTGRNVPVPESTMRTARRAAVTTAQVREELAHGVVGPMAVGGSSVTCGGMADAIGSPKSSRACLEGRRPGLGDGDGDAVVRHGQGPYSAAGQQPDGVADPCHGGRRDDGGALGAAGEDAVELGRVVEQLGHPRRGTA